MILPNNRFVLRSALAVALCVAIMPLGVLAGTTSPAAGAGAQMRKGPTGSIVDSNGYPCVAGEILVELEPSVGISSAKSIHAQAGVKKFSAVKGRDGLQAAKLPADLTVSEAVALYQGLPGVAYAQPNYLYRASGIPNDPRFEDLWGMNNEGQTGGLEDADIDAPEAWDVQTGTSEITVAVIDTGVDYNHPDLVDNIWTNPGEIAGNGLDDDDNGYVDDVHGYDFFNYDGDPIDDNSHGTHCSGTIGASADNGIGVAGVAWDVNIMALKFLSADGWGDTAGAIESISYADQMGADIMSNSWGGGGYDRLLEQAIADTDALFVAAAGNDMSDTDQIVNYPSCYDLPNVLAVGASNMYDEMVDFSNYGAETVDVFAPGEDVWSTVAGPAARFEPAILGASVVDSCDATDTWDVADFNEQPWEINLEVFVEGTGALAHLNYQNDEDAWARLAAPLDLSTAASPALRFQAYYDTEMYFDALNVWASPDGVEWQKLGSFSGQSNGFVSVDCDLSGFIGDPDVYIAFSFTSDFIGDGSDGFTGVAVDDVQLVELDSIFTERFDDLSAWDASDYAENPWVAQSDWFTSAPGAAGNLDYADNEESYLKLLSPLDLSGEAGSLALNAQVFFELEPSFDNLRILVSTDGADWTTTASYSAWSGIMEPGFMPVSIDLSALAGEPQVYLALLLESDDVISGSEMGLTGAAVDDLNLVRGTWSEPDYANAYDMYSGTSMATPHISGLAALIMSEWPGKSATQVKKAIIQGADQLPQYEGLCVSNGRANALTSIGDLYGPDITTDATASYTGAAEIELNATDDSGVTSITYRFDDDQPITVDGDSAVASNTIPARYHTLTYWAEDTLGNVSDPVTLGFVLYRGAVSSVAISGGNRYETAAAASAVSFPDGADTVVIATGANWPDALGGTALAGAVDGPILLTTPDALPDAVGAEIERLGASHVYVLGGTGAVSGDVITELDSILGPGSAERIAGSSRYQTARLIADEVIALSGTEYDGKALVATGGNFPDALAAAPIARHKGWPILLAEPSGRISVPDEVSSAVILGGTGAVPDGVQAALESYLGQENVMRKGGNDRYGTASIISSWSTSQGMHWEGVGITTGRNFADALAGGAMLGSMRSVILLTDPNSLPAAVTSPLYVNRQFIQTVHFIGGSSAISDGVRDGVMSAVE